MGLTFLGSSSRLPAPAATVVFSGNRVPLPIQRDAKKQEQINIIFPFNRAFIVCRESRMVAMDPQRVVILARALSWHSDGAWVVFI
jgi:hypothetical protein